MNTMSNKERAKKRTNERIDESINKEIKQLATDKQNSNNKKQEKTAMHL